MAEEAITSSETMASDLEKLRDEHGAAVTSSETMASDLAKLREETSDFAETKALLNEAVTHSEDLSAQVESMTAELEQARSMLKEADESKKKQVRACLEQSDELRWVDHSNATYICLARRRCASPARRSTWSRPSSRRPRTSSPARRPRSTPSRDPSRKRQRR